MLHINQDDYSGFEITFTNGWKASVQFGPNTLSDNQYNIGYNDSTNAEVRAWDNTNASYIFEEDGLAYNGFVPVDKIADFLMFIRNKESV